MIFRVRYKIKGGHTHCSLFSAKQPNTTFANCGNFVIRNDEFKELVIAMSGIQFLDDASYNAEEKERYREK